MGVGIPLVDQDFHGLVRPMSFFRHAHFPFVSIFTARMFVENAMFGSQSGIIVIEFEQLGASTIKNNGFRMSSTFPRNLEIITMKTFRCSEK